MSSNERGEGLNVKYVQNYLNHPKNINKFQNNFLIIHVVL